MVWSQYISYNTVGHPVLISWNVSVRFLRSICALVFPVMYNEANLCSKGKVPPVLLPWQLLYMSYINSHLPKTNLQENIRLQSSVKWKQFSSLTTILGPEPSCIAVLKIQMNIRVRHKKLNSLLPDFVKKLVRYWITYDFNSSFQCVVVTHDTRQRIRLYAVRLASLQMYFQFSDTRRNVIESILRGPFLIFYERVPTVLRRHVARISVIISRGVGFPLSALFDPSLEIRT